MVYGDKYNKDSIKDWPEPTEVIDKNNWFLNFEDEKETNDDSSSKQEGEPVKRKRGRPKKNFNETYTNDNTNEEVKQNNTVINDTSFSDILSDKNDNENLSVDIINDGNNEETQIRDNLQYALLARVNNDPITFDEAMNSRDKIFWQEAIKDELNSLNKNKVWKIVKRPYKTIDGKRPNIIDSKWVFKRKLDKDGNTKFKARLVIRGFKDRNIYDLSETYAPVSRLSLVRSVLAIINKLKLNSRQLDVKTAFLNGTIDEEIYMEIPQGINCSDENKRMKVCKLERALYGLRISPKRWHERLTLVLKSIGLNSDKNEPCIFVWNEKPYLLILLIYVDDMIIASNNDNKLHEVILKLESEFELTNLGEPREFLGII